MDGTYAGEQLLCSMTMVHFLQERLKIAFGGQNFGDWELISTALRVKKMPFECHTLRVSGKKCDVLVALSLFQEGSKLAPSGPSDRLSRNSHDTVSLDPKAQAGSRWQRHGLQRHDAWREFRRNICNPDLSKMFLLHQLGLTMAQLRK